LPNLPGGFAEAQVRCSQLFNFSTIDVSSQGPGSPIEEIAR
jgi:hypothetical protein